MSKESRRRQRAGGQPTTSDSSGQRRPTESPAAGSPTSSTTIRPEGDRTGRRVRQRPSAQRTFMERFRLPIVAVAVLAAVALIGIVATQSAAQAAYGCSTRWDPVPTAAPAAGASAQPGYVQPDMGQGHPATGTKVTYTYCPPASGKHYNAAGVGPLPPRLYSPTDTVIPEGWVHNLEHGALVVLYRGDSQAATTEGQAALRTFFEGYPASPVCAIPPRTSVGPVVARFDDMAWPMAALVWGRVLPLQSFDSAAILAFDQAYGEQTNPEQFCSPPSASPSAAATPGSN